MLFEMDACSQCRLRHFTKIDYDTPEKPKGAVIIPSTSYTSVKKTPEYRFLRTLFKAHKMDIQDFIIIPAVQCNGVKSKDKDIKDILSICSQEIRRKLKAHDIKNVFACGIEAVRSLTDSAGWKIKGQEQGKDNFWRGFKIPDRDLKAYITCAQSISYIQDKDIPKSFFEDDFKLFIDSVNNYEAPPYDLFDGAEDEEKIVEILTEKQAVKFLRMILKHRPWLLTIDLETTGLKPHNKAHQIPYISFAWGAFDAVAFRITDRHHKLLKKVLTSEIAKGAHNLKFEAQWLRAVLGIEVEAWTWDSMIASHIIDNRPNITSLKFQAFLYFGLAGYETNMKKYWASQNPEQGENSINKIHTANPRQMMTYCAIDSLMTWRLIEQQMKTMSPQEMDAYSFMHEGILALVDVEMNGIRYNASKSPAYMRKAERKKLAESKKLAKTEIGIAWKEEFGDSMNYFSTGQLARVMYEILRYPITKRTKPTKTAPEGNPSTDNEVLEELAQTEQWAESLLIMRQWEKVRGTFLKGFERECGEDGRIHPSFNLNTTATFRSSSTSPNFQNIPIRNPKFSAVLRGCFIASEGHRLIEVDYSGVEVAVAAWYHKDPEMLKYITDPSTDMHRDMALKIFKIDVDQMDAKKVMRKATKNSFVFPQFYGDYYKNCASNIHKWILSGNIKTADGVPAYEHLATKGVKSYQDFEDHMEGIENWFWKEKFKAYGKWKEAWFKEYKKNHEFYSYLGFPYRGVMNDRAVNNYAIQGTGFHILLWSLIQINNWIKENNLTKYIKIVGQIHDSIVADVHDDYVDRYVRKSHAIMTKATRRKFDFIITPLDVEYDITPVNGSWHEKQTFSKNDVLNGKHKE